MSETEDEKLLRHLNEVYGTILANTKRPSDPERPLLACSLEVWVAIGFHPDDYEEWLDTGFVPERSIEKARP